MINHNRHSKPQHSLVMSEMVGAVATYRGVEQMAARQSHKLKAAGSSPASATKHLPPLLVSCPEPLRRLFFHGIRMRYLMIYDNWLGDLGRNTQALVKADGL